MYLFLVILTSSTKIDDIKAEISALKQEVNELKSILQGKNYDFSEEDDIEEEDIDSEVVYRLVPCQRTLLQQSHLILASSNHAMLRDGYKDQDQPGPNNGNPILLPKFISVSSQDQGTEVPDTPPPDSKNASGMPAFLPKNAGGMPAFLPKNED